MATGPTDMPFARAEVLALLPNLANSFKISQATEWMGTITADRDTAISGIPGRRATLAPLEIRVGENGYHMNMAQDRVMTPLVAQMAVFSAIDSTERSVGAATYAVRGHTDFDGGSVKLDNVYSGDVSVVHDGGAGRGDAALLRVDQRLRRAAAEEHHAGHRAARDPQPDADRRYRRLRARRVPARMSRSTVGSDRRERRGDHEEDALSRAHRRAGRARSI